MNILVLFWATVAGTHITIDEMDLDLLNGWYFEDYDAPYLVGRMEQLGVSTNRMARKDGSVNLSGSGWADV